MFATELRRGHCARLLLVVTLGVVVPLCASAATRYVWTNSPSALAPYTSWDTAARTLQEAVDASVAGDLVWATNGVYATGGTAVHVGMTNRVTLDKAITLRSVNGPDVTVIRGEGPQGTGAVRCAYLTVGSVLAGFTLTNGYTLAEGDAALMRGGGGAICDGGGVVSNCISSGNSAAFGGAGVYCYAGGTVRNSKIFGNQGGYGVGVYLRDGGLAENCLIVGNSARTSGGGISLHGGGVARNCTITGNRSDSTRGGGGAYFPPVGPATGRVENCIIYNNTNLRGGVDYDNWGFVSGGAPGTFVHSCTTPDPGGVGMVTNSPAFTDAAAGDFGLLIDSPCIDAGTNGNWMAGVLDLDGKPRVINGVSDIGGYESGRRITATQADHGTLTPAGVSWVGLGGSLTFTVTPDLDYLLGDLTVDGGTVPATNSYTFSNVIGDHTIASAFVDSGATRVIRLAGDLAFDSLIAGNTSSRTLTLWNDGNSALTVTAIAYPDGFSGAWAGTLSAGGSAAVEVTFAPALAGTYGGVVTVSSDRNLGTPTRAISGTAVAVTRVIRLEGDLDFGSVEVWTTSNRTLRIWNDGNSALNVSRIAFPSGFGGTWAGTIAAGESYAATVRFVPGETLAYGGTVTVHSDRTSGTRTTTVSGTGVHDADTAPAVPVNPIGTMSVGSWPIFFWQTVPDASFYQVSITKGGEAYYTEWVEGTNMWTPSWDMSDNPGSYAWQVRTWAPAGLGVWTDAEAFWIGVPGPVSLTSPTGLVTSAYPTLQWKKAEDATWYQLYINRDGVYHYSEWLEGTNRWQPSWNMSDYPGVYEWWVQTWGNDAYGAWSEGARFWIDTPGAATLLWPTGLVSVAQPYFAWTADAAATWYQVYINRDGVYYYSTWVEGATTWSPSWDMTDNPGAYEWWVQTWGDEQEGAWSEPGTFWIGVPGRPVLTSPKGALSAGETSFVWTPGTGASTYRVYVTKDGTNCCSGWTDDTSYQLSTALAVGEYAWSVYTYFTAGYGTWSDEVLFEVVEAPVIPQPASPSGTTTDTQPTFSWVESSGAEGYRIYVSSDDGYEVLDESTTTTWTPSASLSGGNYSWWVAAWSSALGYGPWSSEGTFSLLAPPAATTLIGPLASVSGDAATFSWWTVNNATWYWVYIHGNGVYYYDFWTQDTSWIPTWTLPAGSYEWWVETWNSYGYGDWTGTGSFTVP